MSVACNEEVPASAVREQHETLQYAIPHEFIKRVDKMEQDIRKMEVKERSNLLQCFESTKKDRDNFKKLFQKISIQLALYKERLQHLEKNQKLEEDQKQRISDKFRKASTLPSDVTKMRRALADLAVAYDNSSRKTPPSALIHEHISEFYSNISLPGVKYCMEQGRHSFERYMWIVVIIFCLLISSQFIQESYIKWRDSPTLLSFNDSMSSVGILPFPAVTVCAPGQINSKFPLSSIMEYCNDFTCHNTQKNKLLAAQLLNSHCDILPKSDGTTHSSEVIDVIKSIARGCTDFIPSGDITFKNKDLPCEYGLQTTFVDGKVCHTFNMLPATDMFYDHVILPAFQNEIIYRKPNWTLEYSILQSQNLQKTTEIRKRWTLDSLNHSGFFVDPDPRKRLFSKFDDSWIVKTILTSDDIPEALPRSSNNSGLGDGLRILLRNSQVPGKDYCPFPNNYTKIALHPPGEMPSSETHTFHRLQNNHLNVLRITPHLVTAQEELLDYPPYKRKCFFSHERKLSLFRVYTKRNCQLECKVNCSLSFCGCIPFHLPRPNSSVAICRADSVCGRNTKLDFQNNTFLWRLNPTDSSREENPYKMSFGPSNETGFTNVVTENHNNTEEMNITFNNDTEYVDYESAGLQIDEVEFFDQLEPLSLIIEDDITKLPRECVCNCGADCVSLTYSVTPEDQLFDHTEKFPDQSLGLALSYKESEFTSTIRKELIGFTDFIANSGGVLGVFTGFSFLAVAELFYYLTFRLWSSIKRSWEETEEKDN